MSRMLEQVGRLLCVKSLVTLILTAVFAVLALRGAVSQEFMTVYTVVVSFYFGTQHARAEVGAPAGAQRSGSGGERTSGEMSELSATAGSERYGAREDDGTQHERVMSGRGDDA